LMTVLRSSSCNEFPCHDESSTSQSKPCHGITSMDQWFHLVFTHGAGWWWCGVLRLCGSCCLILNLHHELCLALVQSSHLLHDVLIHPIESQRSFGKIVLGDHEPRLFALATRHADNLNRALGAFVLNVLLQKVFRNPTAIDQQGTTDACSERSNDIVALLLSRRERTSVSWFHHVTLEVAYGCKSDSFTHEVAHNRIQTHNTNTTTPHKVYHVLVVHSTCHPPIVPMLVQSQPEHPVEDLEVPTTFHHHECTVP
jgi:hypothetical protein